MTTQQVDARLQVRDANGDLVTALRQADVETITRSWSITDGNGAALVGYGNVEFHARNGDLEVTWTVGGGGGTIAGIVDNGNATGTWRVAAGDLAAGNWRWWALVTVDGDRRIPAAMSGELVIADR